MSVTERPARNGLSEAEKRLRDMAVMKIEPILAGTGYWGRADAEFADALAAETSSERRQEWNQRVEQLAHARQDLGSHGAGEMAAITLSKRSGDK